MTMITIIAIAIFVAVLILISTELVHKAIASLGGAVLFIILGIVGTTEAFHNIDWSVIILLVGLMLMVSVLKQTGVFQFIAIKAAKIAQGNPVSIMLLMSVVSALTASLLGTVTTVLIMAPVLILIAVELAVTPMPYLIALAVAANMGGASTLIGDPTSVIIGSAAGFSFMRFVTNNGIAIVFALAALLGIFYLTFRKQLKVSNERRARIMEFDESRSIEDYPLLWKCLAVLTLVIAGFIFGSYIHIEPSVIALSGAILMIVLKNPHSFDQLLMEVEWGTIWFFVGLFIMVLGLENLGIIEMMAKGLMGLTGGDLLLTTIVLIWASGIISAFVDNIPFVVAMVPLIQNIALQIDQKNLPGAIPGAEAVVPLWWALSLGAVFGGNGTLIGASANVVTAGIASKNGHPISFASFMRYSAPVALSTLCIATGYIVLRYFVLA